MKNKFSINFLDTIEVKNPEAFYRVPYDELTLEQKKNKKNWEINSHKVHINKIIDIYVSQLERFRHETSLERLPVNFKTLRYPAIHPVNYYVPGSNPHGFSKRWRQENNLW